LIRDIIFGNCGDREFATKLSVTRECGRSRLCRKEEETFQHVFEMCEISGEKHESWKQQINGVQALARMWSITWKRKREEEKLV